MKISNYFFHYGDYDQETKLHGWENINWRTVIELILYHFGALCLIFVGVSWIAVLSFIFFDLISGFSVTVVLHRYFTHRCFETSRRSQFIFALFALTPLQRGPLWWTSHHRRHHHLADQPGDPHTPMQGLFYSHLGWLMTLNNSATDPKYIKDWMKYPELIWIDRFEWLAPIVAVLSAYLYGTVLNHFWPTLGTSGWQMVVWIVCIPTILVLHGSCMVNSCLHSIGYCRFNLGDHSRNSWWLAFLTFGEGFHNNHHRYSESCNQGIKWWEIDISYYVIKLMEKLGIIWNLRVFPKSVVEEGKCILRSEN